MKAIRFVTNLTDAHNPAAPAAPHYLVYFRDTILALDVSHEKGDMSSTTPLCLNEVDMEKKVVTRNCVAIVQWWQIQHLLENNNVFIGQHEARMKMRAVDENEMADKAVELLEFFGDTKFTSTRGAYFRHCVQQRTQGPKDEEARKNLIHWLAATLNNLGETELLLRLVQNKEL